MSKKRKNTSGKPGKGKKKKPARNVTPDLQATDEPKILRFFVAGKSYELDCNPDHLANRDRIELEEYMGMPFLDVVFSGWFKSFKAMSFLAFLAMRAKDQNATLDVVIDDFESVEEVDPDDPPTQTPSETPDSSGDQS